jgi:hypothetical protein
LLIPQYLDQLRAYDRALLSRTAEVFSTSYYVLSAGVLAVMLLIAMQSRLWIWQRLIALGVVQNLFIITLFMAGVAELQQRPVKDAGLLAKVLDEPVVSYGLRMPSFSVYRQAVTPEQLPEVGQLVYTRTDKVAGLQKDLGPDAVLEEVFGMAHIRLVRLVSLGTE